MATREQNLRHRYGIGVKEYDELFEKQKGTCAICGLREKRHLDVDHCHTSKKVRGLLCRNCNTALGKVYDNPKILVEMFLYLYANREPEQTELFAQAFNCCATSLLSSKPT